jgi:hypothetical protein
LRKTISNRSLLLLVIFVVASTASFGASIRAPYRTTRVARHTRRTRVRRVVHWNPLLRGSRESMLRQNDEIDRLQLVRIANDDELLELVASEELVPLEDTRALLINPSIEENRRYARAWTRDFVNDISDDFYSKFHQKIILTSAVRTQEQQEKLRHKNHNAAPSEGEIASSHLAGTTIDFAKKGMSRAERKWFDHYVYDLQQVGLVEAAEERRQACYHIMVSERYTGWREANRLAVR